MRNSYRIVRDNYLRYEVQIKFWYFPFMWFQCYDDHLPTNTFPNLNAAEAYAKKHANKICVVKNLGKLP